MFGTSLIVCFSLLLHGIAAKPYKSLNELSIQDTIMTEEWEEQHWGLQEAPPESLDVSFDIDPSMKIWKRVDQSGPDGEYQLAEGDQAELQHPSLVEVVPLNQGEFHHPSMVEAVPLNQDVSDSDAVPDVPGQDEEELQYEVVREYLAPLAGNIAGGRPYPAEDTDHADREASWDVRTGSDVMSPPGAQLHSEPEEDLDDLYHADQLVQVEVQPPAGSDIKEEPVDRLHQEPEEDMDDLYHRDQIVPEGPYPGLARDPDVDHRVADEDDL